MSRALVVVVAVVAAACSALPARAADPPTRVFIAGISVGAQADAQVVSLLEDKLLVLARRHEDRFEVLGATDVQGILQAEAAAQAVGCDQMSCASELADALDAPQLVTGQLGKVGERWLLTLTRTDRRTMKVVARTQTEAVGTSPEQLLERMPAQVDELFGAAPAPMPWLAIGGAATAGLGVVVAALGGGSIGYSYVPYGEAQRATTNADHLVARGQSELFAYGGAAALAIGVVVVVAGAVVAGVGLILPPGEAE